ncbi:MAG: serine/threonine protein kinase, partial [Deltaproteobacteria bacterium]|nr:serine/threonine protein kinase [Deltaproteobacteria bacterium]
MINHYEVIRLLGKGGMGAVYLARDTKLGRRVAIKFLLTKHPEMTERFILEARNTALFNHENIIIIFEVDQWEGSPFMVFEFLTGQELTKLIPDGKPMPVPRVAELMVPVCRALQYAHAQGIVHRDLKPDNIQVTESGTVKVLDFGIAKAMNKEEDARERASEEAPSPDASGGNKELTQSGAIMGTIAYMSPEQWGIGVSIDHRADIWAVGIMLFRMLAGEHPLHPLRGEQLMITGILEQPMPRLKSKLPTCPDDLASVVDKCLMKVKEERWPDSASLVKALEAFMPG